MFDLYPITAYVGLLYFVGPVLTGSLVIGWLASKIASRPIRVLAAVGVLFVEVVLIAVLLTPSTGSLPMAALWVLPPSAPWTLFFWLPALAQLGYVAVRRKTAWWPVAFVALGALAVAVVVLFAGGMATGAPTNYGLPSNKRINPTAQAPYHAEERMTAGYAQLR